MLMLMMFLLAAFLYAQEKGQQCAQGGADRKWHGELFGDIGTVAHPLHGWVGYTDTGDPVSGVTINCFTSDSKSPIASTITDGLGKFSFPSLKPGLITWLAQPKMFLKSET
jgi:hypothetical protein